MKITIVLFGQNNWFGTNVILAGLGQQFVDVVESLTLDGNKELVLEGSANQLCQRYCSIFSDCPLERNTQSNIGIVKA